MGKAKLRDTYLYRGGLKTKGLNDLCEYIKNTGKTIYNIADIGSYAGESFLIFHQNFKKTANIFCIDNWNTENLRYTKRDNLETEMINAELNCNERIRGLKRVTKIKADIMSDNFIKKIPDKYFDLIYLDTVIDCDLYEKHLQTVLPKLKQDCFISGSNYNYSDDFNNVIKNTVGEIDVYFCDSSWLKKI